jgi:hypothetical protein
MPKVRLAGTVRGERDPNREIRARLLYSLFSRGWDIYNSNGDQRISLGNIERKIIESDAFVFTPGATLEDLFKAVSIFVGYQTLDRHLSGKPTVLLNTDRSWDGLFSLLTHLNQLGTVKQQHEDYLFPAVSAEEVVEILEVSRRDGLPEVERVKSGSEPVESFETPLMEPTTTAYGTWSGGRFMHFGETLSEERFIGCIETAYDAGIRTFVTSDVYGNGKADELLGRRSRASTARATAWSA